MCSFPTLIILVPLWIWVCRNSYCLLSLRFWALDILSYLVNHKTPPEFIMEVTDKTRADVKVGYWPMA